MRSASPGRSSPDAGRAREGRRLEPVRGHREESASSSSIEPAAKDAARLDPDRSPPDAFELVGRALYLHLGNGAGRTKLTGDYLERTLGVRGTQRNWSTVVKLLELARERYG